MRFILDYKIYDTEKSELIIEYRAPRELKNIICGTYTSKIPTSLYRTEKGNWFSVSTYNGSQAAYVENEGSVKKIFADLDKVDLYTKYFGELQEA